MVRSVIFLFFFVVISFDSLESATIQCEYKYNSWSIAGNLYSCFVSNGITINSPETANIDLATGSHQSGYINDNLNYFYTTSVAISYFPRGLDKIFKNLKGIRFDYAGFKEIHQSDLKPFPKLIEFLIIYGSHVEILEEGLFDFNPDLQYLNLQYNKISHIDPKLFDSLTKLKQLHLTSNFCINKGATDRTSVQNLIKELKPICNNSDYSSLDQKLKFLNSESKSINLNDFKEEFKDLENKINASKFVNFYQPRLQKLKIILDEKLFEATNCISLNDSLLKINKNVQKVDENISNFTENMLNISHTVIKVEDEISSLKESFSNFNKEALIEFKDNFAKNNENYSELKEEVVIVKKAVEGVDKKLEEFNKSISISRASTTGIESDTKTTYEVRIESINKAAEKIENKLMEKMDKNLIEINNKVQEGEQRFNEWRSKIMKALKGVFDASDMTLNCSVQDVSNLL
ncbi:hypothetical protein ACKWTF_009408 [Chironomus riparius]